MSNMSIAAFDRTIEKTHHWLADLMEELGWDEPELAYHALRAVLHALRDQLAVQEAVDLAAQFPMLIRGMYFEGWTPRNVPARDKTEDRFLDALPRNAVTIRASILRTRHARFSGCWIGISPRAKSRTSEVICLSGFGRSGRRPMVCPDARRCAKRANRVSFSHPG